ncbi:tRNA (N(6)-L-threonylcarbamoyladenosine(37)-C(2))-methylthiotransferase MtaB [Desulfovulcanus sp.]
MNKFYITTLGCKINQYETQAIIEAWQKRGDVLVAEPEQAEVIIVNSCAVTERAVRDLKKLLRKLAQAAPEARIIVAGCAAEVMEQELKELKEVDSVIPQSQKTILLHPNFPTLQTSNLEPRTSNSNFPPFHITNYFRARAVVKIQDGCSHKCTYCIVPLTRGPSRSRQPEAILNEIEHLLNNGLKEISLCGINLRHFGRDLSPKTDFWDLLLQIQQKFGPKWQGKVRIRISSLEPSELTDKALNTLRQATLVCPHLHISLQSASPNVLKGMGRAHYHPESLENFVQQLKDIWPLFGLGMDILVGFPGESEQDFQTTYDFCARIPLSYAHVFPYSKRPHTVAARFSNQIPAHIKKERAAILRELIQKKKTLFLNKLVKLPQVHLVLENENQGMTEYYVQARLKNPDPSLCARQIIKARPVGIWSNGLTVIGEMVK